MTTATTKTATRRFITHRSRRAYRIIDRGELLHAPGVDRFDIDVFGFHFVLLW